MKKEIEKPMMDDECVEKIKEILLGFKGKHLDILEWGSGKSTIYFTEFLRRNGISYSWDTIEDKREWISYVKTRIREFGLKNVSVYCRLEKKIYFELPSDKKYDVVFVDGCWRRNCLKFCERCIKKEGIILLHDAHWYKGFLDKMEEGNRLKGEFITKKTWKGKPL